MTKLLRPHFAKIIKAYQKGRSWRIISAPTEIGVDNLLKMAYNDYVVDIEWNLTTGNIRVKKDDRYVDLKIGV